MSNAKFNSTGRLPTNEVLHVGIINENEYLIHLCSDKLYVCKKLFKILYSTNLSLSVSGCVRMLKNSQKYKK